MASDVLALIPARAGSKGIPNKNFGSLDGVPPVTRAVVCAAVAGIPNIVVSSDVTGLVSDLGSVRFLQRPPELAADTSAMIDVVKHALSEIPGPSDQIILLVQPTQVLRQPKHLRAAIELLESSDADSVISVVEIPRTHHPELVIVFDEELRPNPGTITARRWAGRWDEFLMPTRRQDVEQPYIRDGTVYAFRRATVRRYDTIYGENVRPLIIDPSETCALDTPSDWAEAERRLRAQA